MKIIPFKGGHIFIRTYGYESWVEFKKPPRLLKVLEPREAITVCLESTITTDGIEEAGGFATYEEALESAKELIEDFS
jgi:hypothetical protein